jgi:hypothetical protein
MQFSHIVNMDSLGNNTIYSMSYTPTMHIELSFPSFGHSFKVLKTRLKPGVYHTQKKSKYEILSLFPPCFIS